MWKISKECQKLMTKMKVKDLKGSIILRNILKMDQNKKVQHEIALKLMITVYRKHTICESLGRLFGVGGNLSGQVKILTGEWILRVTCPNDECCQIYVQH